MKLVTFERSGERHIGALLADGITLCDFTASRPAVPHFRDMLALIDGGPVALDQAGELVRGPGDRVRLAEVRVLAPVPEPRQMRDFLCFEQHIRQARSNRYLFGQGEKLDPATIELPQVRYDRPIYYKCNRFSVIGIGGRIAGRPGILFH